MAYGFLGLKPEEFWKLQPKDVIVMNDGYQMKREYDESIHLETMRLLRYSAYCTYISIPTKKGVKKDKLTNFYPLPKDRVSKPISIEEINAVINAKVIYISNGKKRGYIDAKGQLFCSNDKSKLIGNIVNNEIKYLE